MGIAFVGAWTGVQFASNAGGSTAARSVTAGNFLAICTSGDLNPPGTVTTSASDTVAQANPSTGNTGDFIRCQYVVSAVGGASVTIGISHTSPHFSAITAAEYSGLDATTPLDQHSVAGTGSGATLTSASVTTTQADELIITHGTILAATDNVWAAGASNTIRSQTNLDSVSSCTFTQERIVSSIASYNATATKSPGSGAWIMGIATFKAAATASAAATPPAILYGPGMQGPMAFQWTQQVGVDATTVDIVTAGQVATVNLQGVASTASMGGVSVAGQSATLNLQGVGHAATVGGVSTAGQVAVVNLQGVGASATGGAVSVAGQVATVNLQGVAAGSTVGGVSVAGQTAILNLQGVASSASPPTSTPGQTATLNLQGVGHAATVGGVSVAGQTAVVNLQGVSSTVTAAGVNVAGQVATLTLQGVAGTAVLTAQSYIFRPHVVRDRDYGPERLWRNITPGARSVNVFQLADGSYVEKEPVPGTVILHTYLGGHDNPIDATERASLIAAGYGGGIV